MVHEMRVTGCVMRLCGCVLQSMRAGLQGQGGWPAEGHVAPPPSNNDPDLVAFWNFDFDAAPRFVIKDVTDHGNDLMMSGPPTFEVIRWMKVCGNGVVEGDEECDTGSLGPGTGCSADCRVRLRSRSGLLTSTGTYWLSKQWDVSCLKHAMGSTVGGRDRAYLSREAMP